MFRWHKRSAQAARPIEWPTRPHRAEAVNMPLPTRKDGLLEVTCWCERATVLMTAADVKAGRTESCGRAGCREPAST